MTSGRPSSIDRRSVSGTLRRLEAGARKVSATCWATDWPDGGDAKHHTVLVVGHQPTLGRTAALLLSGSKAYWSIKKGSVWWFSNRTRLGETQSVLRAVIPAELASSDTLDRQTLSLCDKNRQHRRQFFAISSP